MFIKTPGGIEIHALRWLTTQSARATVGASWLKPGRTRMIGFACGLLLIAATASRSSAESNTTNIIDGTTSNVAGDFYVGSYPGTNNVLVVTNSGALNLTSGALYVGYLNDANTVTIIDNSLLSSIGANIGIDCCGIGSGNNSVMVSGGSIWTNSSTLTIGGGSGGSSRNQLTISNGGKVFNGQ